MRRSASHEADAPLSPAVSAVLHFLVMPQLLVGLWFDSAHHETI